MPKRRIGNNRAPYRRDIEPHINRSQQVFAYLASPYTHANPLVVERRYLQALHATHLLLASRIPVYSPIVHCHHLAQANNLPTDASFWKWYNKNMLAAARKLLILKLDGWQKSEGVAGEKEFALELSLPLRGVEVAKGDQLVFSKIV
jgi:hypothetical protein